MEVKPDFASESDILRHALLLQLCLDTDCNWWRAASPRFGGVLCTFQVKSNRQIGRTYPPHAFHYLPRALHCEVHPMAIGVRVNIAMSQHSPPFRDFHFTLSSLGIVEPAWTSPFGTAPASMLLGMGSSIHVWL